MLVIDPAECIDCGVCEPECPAGAILADSEPDTAQWVTFNEKYAALWPVIVEAKEPMRNAEQNDGKSGKLETMFSERPAPVAA